jgi:hypothetical protein
MHAILSGESFNGIISVFPDSFERIAGDAGVQRSISFAGQDLDAGIFVHSHKS